VKMGVPLAAVRIKMMADGVCVVPAPEEPTEVTKRQRLAWQAVDGGRRRNSIWHHDSPLTSPSADQLEGPNMVVLSPDALEEFERHWTKRVEVPKNKKKCTAGKTKLKEVHVVDAKKSMNASIALARVMRSCGSVNVAQDVYCLRDNNFSPENLLSMLEYAPTKFDIVKLKTFISSKQKKTVKSPSQPKSSQPSPLSASSEGGMANVFAQLKQKETNSEGGMANVFAQLKQKETNSEGGMANVFAQLKQKETNSEGGMANVFAQLKQKETNSEGGMANVFAQLKQKETNTEGGMANVFAQLKKTKSPQVSAKTELDMFSIANISSIPPLVECLSEGEQYMCLVMCVPQFEDRLKALSFKCGFDSRIKTVKDDTKLLTTACASIKRSEKLKKLLKIVLQLGNKVNEAEGAGILQDTTRFH
jgi:hypothetical protein